jgi:hypothetical protein
MRYDFLMILLLSILSACGPSPLRQTPRATPIVVQPVPVVYSISGTAFEVSLTYRNASGATEQIDVIAAWSLKFEAKPGQFLYLSAQKKGERGSVSCKITANGRVVQEGTSTSAYGIASCSGSA